MRRGRWNGSSQRRKSGRESSRRERRDGKRNRSRMRSWRGRGRWSSKRISVKIPQPNRAIFRTGSECGSVAFRPESEASNRAMMPFKRRASFFSCFGIKKANSSFLRATQRDERQAGMQTSGGDGALLMMNTMNRQSFRVNENDVFACNSGQSVAISAQLQTSYR